MASKNTRKLMVRFNDDALKMDIKQIGYSESYIAQSIGKNCTAFSAARISGTINPQIIKDFCEKYFSGEGNRWERYVNPFDHAKYEEFLGLSQNGSLDKRIPAKFDVMEEDLRRMNVTAQSASKIFGFNKDYFAKSKGIGVISVVFCEKLAELTGNTIKNYLPEEKKEEPKKEEVVSDNKTFENIEDINACTISILKILQRIDENMQKIAQELGVK